MTLLFLTKFRFGRAMYMRLGPRPHSPLLSPRHYHCCARRAPMEVPCEAPCSDRLTPPRASEVRMLQQSPANSGLIRTSSACPGVTSALLPSYKKFAGPALLPFYDESRPLLHYPHPIYETHTRTVLLIDIAGPDHHEIALRLILQYSRGRET